jgi:hypothetical protein
VELIAVKTSDDEHDNNSRTVFEVDKNPMI